MGVLEKRSTLYLIGSLAILSVLILVAVTSFTSRPTTTSTTSTETKSGTPGHDSCVDNGFLTAQVDDTSGVYTFDIGTCAGLSGSTCFFAGNQTAFPECNYILYPSGTSFASVRDFTTNVNYTESGAGLGTSLGVPTSSTVVGNSILTVFSPNGRGVGCHTEHNSGGNHCLNFCDTDEDASSKYEHRESAERRNPLSLGHPSRGLRRHMATAV